MKLPTQEQSKTLRALGLTDAEAMVLINLPAEFEALLSSAEPMTRFQLNAALSGLSRAGMAIRTTKRRDRGLWVTDIARWAMTERAQKALGIAA